MFKLLGGWVLITLTYFLTLAATFTLYPILIHEPTDYNWNVSGTFIGIPLVIVPYVIAGLYVRSTFVERRAAAVWVSLIPMVGERLLIYFIGRLFVLSGGDGTMSGITTMTFIRGEAAPYYTYTYILCGFVSVAVCMIAAAYSPQRIVTGGDRS